MLTLQILTKRFSLFHCKPFSYCCISGRRDFVENSGTVFTKKKELLLRFSANLEVVRNSIIKLAVLLCRKP